MRYRKDSNVSFFAIPSLQRNLWLNAIQRPDLINKSSATLRMCSLHFPNHRVLLDNVLVFSSNDSMTLGALKLQMLWERSKIETETNIVATFMPTLPSFILTEHISLMQQQIKQLQDSLFLAREANILLSQTCDSQKSQLQASMNLQAQFAHRVNELLSGPQPLVRQPHKSGLMSGFTISNLLLEPSNEQNELIRFYTGLPSVDSFNSVFNALQVDSSFRLWGSPPRKAQQNYDAKPGPVGQDKRDQLFWTLSLLKLNIPELYLAKQIGLSQQHVSKIFRTWVVALADLWNTLPTWISWQKILSCMPSIFQQHGYSNTRVILDGMEIFVQKSTTVDVQSLTWSEYKSHNTAKILVGISPQGWITFLSTPYEGSISDPQLTYASNILEMCEQSQAIMVDRGFQIVEAASKKNIQVHHPPFSLNREKFSEVDTEKTKEIATLRIHVERAIGRLRNFKVLTHIFPLSRADLLGHVVKACALIANCSPPLVT